MGVVSKKCGPWGKEGPPTWSFELGDCETIKGVIIRYGFIVGGIGFIVADKCGKTSTKYYGDQRGYRDEITLKPDEHITHISGTYGVYKYTRQPLIATIKIHTNRCPSGYGPYGKQLEVSNVSSFSSTPQKAGSGVVGFFGSAGGYLTSIGVYIEQDCVEKRGPWGSQSPTNWDMKLGACETIKQVNIRAGYIVDGIGFVIANSSGKADTIYFGGNGGKLYTVTLGPNEHITQISGTYGVYQYSSQCQIATIKIHTNCCPSGYGPFGEEKGVCNVQSFSSKSPCDVAVGFFGKTSQYLDSIGAYVKPCGR